MDRKAEVLIAFGVGVIAGILLAPASGAETRKKIADTADGLISGAKDRVSGAKDSVSDRAESIKAKAGAFKEAVQTARETFREEMDRPRG